MIINKLKNKKYIINHIYITLVFKLKLNKYIFHFK